MVDSDVDSPKEDTLIDLWLDSPGGDANAAYKLFLYLRSKCSCLRVIVPEYAKSAATLITIGADVIYMSESAELGPLDAQIPHPDREGHIVSSLSGANSLEHLTRLGVELSVMLGPQLIDITGLPRGEVLSRILEYNSAIMAPVVSKLDPQLIHEASEALQVTKKYAELIMSTKSDNSNSLSPGRIRKIANSLVTDYPTHGFVIDRRELDKLGIRTISIEEHPLWKTIKKIFDDLYSNGKPGIINFTKSDTIRMGNNDE